MSYSAPEKFEHVTVTCKANLYFDGKVASHTIAFADGSEKTLGLIYPGSFKFNTDAPERIAATALRILGVGDDEIAQLVRQPLPSMPAGAS